MLLEAVRDLDARVLIVGFGDYREELERLSAGRATFTGPLEHRHLVHLIPLADITVVPSIFPEAFGMVAAEAAAGGSLPLVARHSGLAEVAAGLERSIRPSTARSPASRPPTQPTSSASSAPSSRSTSPSASDSAGRPGRRPSSVGAGRASPNACLRHSRRLRAPMTDDRHLTPDELIRTAREAFDNAQDLTLRVLLATPAVTWHPPKPRRVF